MRVSRDELRHVAGLARLSLDEAEEAVLQEELGRILDYVDGLESLEPLADEAPSHTLPGADHPHADPVPQAPVASPEGVPPQAPRETAEDLGPDTLRRTPSEMAPQWVDGFFVVPPPQGVNPEGA